MKFFSEKLKFFGNFSAKTAKNEKPVIQKPPVKKMKDFKKMN